MGALPCGPSGWDCADWEGKTLPALVIGTPSQGCAWCVGTPDTVQMLEWGEDPQGGLLMWTKPDSCAAGLGIWASWPSPAWGTWGALPWLFTDGEQSWGSLAQAWSLGVTAPCRAHQATV